jgi:MFS transporter, putative metabolite:H+ symporter
VIYRHESISFGSAHLGLSHERKEANMTPKMTSKVLNITVIVAALGYFVDIYDLVLFSIVRVASLKSLGVPDGDLLKTGVYLLNMQMAGMLTGGLLWGILGDKRGRVSVLFGSILLYSVANILNAYVTTVEQYGILRFLAGVGLAGELGAAITLVSEVMTKESRGYGTTVVAAVGVSGAVLAATIGEKFPWQTAYIVGGALGLALLVMRVSIFESGLFTSAKHQSARRGNFFQLFQNRERALKYINSILIGVPIWYVIGVLVTFSPEISKELEVTGPVSAAKAIMFTYVGLIFGDLASGLFSQLMKSRKKVVLLFLTITGIFIGAYFLMRGLTPDGFYALCVSLGFGVGYWAVFVTMASEQFGTNLRATVTTTTPNFVRGSVVPLTLAFQALKEHTTLLQSAMYVGLVTMILAFLALVQLKETFGKDLDYVEVS